jgi:hypothetical protein
VEFGRVQNGRNETRTGQRRVRVHWANGNLDLTVDGLLFFGRLANDGKGTDTFTVQAHILGIRLRQANLMALLDELTHSMRILDRVAGSKALRGVSSS